MRVISLSPAVTEIMFALKVGNLIVANTYFCDFPEEAKKIAKAGSFSHVDFEKLKDFKPDLIITSTIVQKKMNEELREKGFKTLYLDPRSLQDILSSIKLIGNYINNKIEAEKLINNLEKEIQQLNKFKLAMKPRVYIEEWYDPPMYSGNWVPDIVKLAGGIYLPSKTKDISKNTQEDELFKFDPEFIFVSYCGFGTKSDPSKVLKRKGWENISAVRNRKVFTLNETILNRPGPRILESVQQIHEIIKKHSNII